MIGFGDGPMRDEQKGRSFAALRMTAESGLAKGLNARPDFTFPSDPRDRDTKRPDSDSDSDSASDVQDRKTKRHNFAHSSKLARETKSGAFWADYDTRAEKGGKNTRRLGAFSFY